MTTLSTYAEGQPPSSALFVSDEEIARRLGVGIDKWRAVRGVLEQRGLPQRDPLMAHKRYWPAVRAFFDRRAGLDSITAPLLGDGENNFDAFR